MKSKGSTVKDLLEIAYPIIQAPMAGGITTNQLIMEVSNQGALGMIGAGYMSATDLKRQLMEIKEQLQKPFGVNVFVPHADMLDTSNVEVAKKLLRPYYERFNVQIEDISIPTTEQLMDNYHEQINSIIYENIKVCSFTFGVPNQEIISRLHRAGIVVIGTATTVKEAQMIEEIGMDMVVLQGSEAGGHRGNFLPKSESSQMGLMSLIPQVADCVQIPIIAAGGIMDHRTAKAAFCLGANGVQMGTAFLLTDESGADPLHKDCIIQNNGDAAVLTNTFSGKSARGIYNDFIQELEEREVELPVYPIQNALTQPIRKAAKIEENPSFMSLWSGQSAGLGKRQTVKMLVEEVIKGIPL